MLKKIDINLYLNQVFVPTLSRCYLPFSKVRFAPHSQLNTGLFLIKEVRVYKNKRESRVSLQKLDCSRDRRGCTKCIHIEVIDLESTIFKYEITEAIPSKQQDYLFLPCFRFDPNYPLHFTQCDRTYSTSIIFFNDVYDLWFSNMYISLVLNSLGKVSAFASQKNRRTYSDSLLVRVRYTTYVSSRTKFLVVG